MADTLERLAADGFESFYTGETARALAADLARAGCPLTGADLASHAARMVEPLTLRSRTGAFHAPPPPTQGFTTLMMLGLFDRLQAAEAEGFDHLHGLIEAAKQAILVRDAVLADPDIMEVDAASFLSPTDLAMRASDIVPNLALGWPVESGSGRYGLSGRCRCRGAHGLHAAKPLCGVWQRCGIAVDGSHTA